MLLNDLFYARYCQVRNYIKFLKIIYLFFNTKIKLIKLLILCSAGHQPPLLTCQPPFLYTGPSLHHTTGSKEPNGTD